MVPEKSYLVAKGSLSFKEELKSILLEEMPHTRGDVRLEFLDKSKATAFGIENGESMSRL